VAHSSAEPTGQERRGLRREREAKVAELERRGPLHSERLRKAMLAVRREEFIPSSYRDHAYEELPVSADDGTRQQPPPCCATALDLHQPPVDPVLPG
jgi:protein-L-isoaspartate O-methyltransferase